MANGDLGTAKHTNGADDRRFHKRLPIFGYGVRYTVAGKTAGHGQTIDMSGGGVLISTESTLTPGDPVELAIDWPVQLDGVVPLKLMVFGRLARVEEKRAAVKIEKYEFRTRRSKLAQGAAIE